VTLRELRKRSRMTQAEMAKVLGRSLRTYSRWENAKDPKIPWSRYAILKARFGL
jgi:transcriptional regulator with XRE-family HTH domain